MPKTRRRFVKRGQSLVFLTGTADHERICVDVFSISPALGHVFHYPTRPDLVKKVARMRQNKRDYHLDLLMKHVERHMPPLLMSADGWHKDCVTVTWWKPKKPRAAHENNHNHSPEPTETGDQANL